MPTLNKAALKTEALRVATKFQRTAYFTRAEIDALVGHMVDRLHVGTSNRAVIRYVASRIKGGVKGFLSLHAGTRKNLMLAAIDRHAKNRNLYNIVMRGY